jgi:shikimate dehydrogenase
MNIVAQQAPLLPAQAGPHGGTARPSILIGLIGAGIQASRTPAMHEAEGDRLGLRYLYNLIDLDRLGVDATALPELLTAAERMGFAGLNITHPCKQAIIPLLDDLSPDARAINAVNTVVLAGGRRVGHNTDSWGFAESLRRELPSVARRKVVQLGAGGAGAAVAYALLNMGFGQLALVDTDNARAEALVARLQEHFGAGRAVVGTSARDVLADADGLVNTTPIGMAKYPGLPLPAELLRRELWVADIIYFPAETELLRRARALGCATMSGEGMALFQAVAAFQLFTGLAPDPDNMRRHLRPADAAS